MAFGIALAAIGVGASLMGLDAQRDASKFARREARLKNLQGGLESERRAREFVRNAQQARAATLSEAVASGGGGSNMPSSTVQGSLGAQRSKVATEIDFFQDFAQYGGNLAQASESRIREQNRANTFQGIGNMFLMASGTFGG